MEIAFQVLRSLSDGKFHSGEQMAVALQVSRSTVWKAVRFLQAAELQVQAIPGRGYRWYEPLELLDANAIRACLPVSVDKSIPRIVVLNLIASTNTYLMKQRRYGLLAGTVCVAEGQTQGRGRMGKQWCSPLASNVYLSFYWRFQKGKNLSPLSLVIALAVIGALQSFCSVPEKTLGVKWPNDVWYAGKKLAGILIESTVHLNNVEVVIGVGLNVCMPVLKRHCTPDLITDLREMWGAVPSRNRLIAALLEKILLYIRLFEQKDFAAFLSLWGQYDLLFGKCVEISRQKVKQSALAQGVNAQGELYLQFEDQLRAVCSGDISVKPASFNIEVV